MRPLRLTMLLGLIVFLQAASVDAGDVKFKVIVHPKNPVSSVDRDFLRNAYLKKETVWRKDQTIRPIDLPAKSAIRVEFSRAVLKKSPSQLKTYWNQQIFSGKGVPPPEVGSVSDVVSYVLTNPGAVGYIPADADPRGAKVIEVK